MTQTILSELQNSEALQRFESLGDNCEFGFVLKSLKHEDGSIFRWASMTTDQLHTLLKNNFKEIYEYDNLFPCAPGMVCDKRYGIAWHTDMKSHVIDEKLTFIANEDQRREIYNNENKKRAHLLQKFISRLQGGEAIYVIKSRSKPGPQVFNGIYQELRRLAQGAAFWMLEVIETSDQGKQGVTELVCDQRMRAYISKYSPYGEADAAQYDEWYKIMQSTLALIEHHSVSVKN